MRYCRSFSASCASLCAGRDSAKAAAGDKSHISPADLPITAGHSSVSASPSSTGKYIARTCRAREPPPSACAAVCHCSSRLFDTSIRHSAAAIAVRDIHASYGSSHSRMKVCTIAPPTPDSMRV